MATTPVFLPGESHGRRSLIGYSPWGREELDVTQGLTNINEAKKYDLVYILCNK